VRRGVFDEQQWDHGHPDIYRGVGQRHARQPVDRRRHDGPTRGATKDATGKVLTGPAVTWSSRNVAFATVAVGRFKNLQPYRYWSCQGAAIQSPCQSAGPAAGFEWSFSFGNGFLGTDLLENDLYVTAYFVGPSNAGAARLASRPRPE
jgi:hypothetical protein